MDTQEIITNYLYTVHKAFVFLGGKNSTYNLI